jgi:hypothetical protein
VQVVHRVPLWREVLSNSWVDGESSNWTHGKCDGLPGETVWELQEKRNCNAVRIGMMRTVRPRESWRTAIRMANTAILRVTAGSWLVGFENRGSRIVGNRNRRCQNQENGSFVFVLWSYLELPSTVGILLSCARARARVCVCVCVCVRACARVCVTSHVRFEVHTTMTIKIDVFCMWHRAIW